MNPTSWYVARSAGIVAYLLLSSSVVVGAMMSSRARLAWPRFAVVEIHRFLAILTGVFLVLHGAGLLIDKVVPFSLAQTLVPFASSYRPFAVGLGVASAELLAAVAVTNAFRGRLPFRLWRKAHYLTIVVWLAATGHALLAGTDRRDGWFIGLAVVCVAAVALAFLRRLSGALDLPAVALTGVAAAVAVLALTFSPQPPSPHRTSTVTAASPAGVPASFSGVFDGQVLTEDSSPVVSVVGRAAGAGLRVDLLVDDGRVEQAALQLHFPSGAACTGTVTSLGSAGLAGTCGSRAVRIDWSIGGDQRVAGRLAVASGGA